MPLYFGHKNNKGLSVSPALQSLGIDMLRASPNQVGVIARPLVVQHGYASYLAHLPAFMKAYNDQVTIPFNKQGYPAALPITAIIPIGHPSLVVDFNGPIPAKHVETLNSIGFERIKMNRTDNIVRFPMLNMDQVREIRALNPNATTPAPVNTVNLQAFESWILVLRVISNLLLAHTYPAFTDDQHLVDELDTLVEDLLKRKAETELQNAPKRVRSEAGQPTDPDEIDIDMNELNDDLPNTTEIELSKAKPPPRNVRGWGTPDCLPNASGLFFPFVPELCSYDTTTVPTLIEDYLIQALGDKPEKQIERMDKIRSAWGLIGKTDPGNAMAHLCKVISLALRAQGRAFPFIRDGVYQGCVLSGGRLFVGMNGSIYRPISYDKLQEETGGYHMHSIVLAKIIEICEETVAQKDMPTTMRQLRGFLLQLNLSEDDRDEIRKLAVHLHFPGERYLNLNSQSVSTLIRDLTSTEDKEDLSLPLHHSALFSRDKVFVALSAFGYQAPSFMIDNCPKIPLHSSKPPQTLVVRQKQLDIATVDWKKMLESKEMRNNPRNLSRANRDRSIVGNDKAVMWGEIAKLAADLGGVAKDKSGFDDTESGGVALDGMDDW